MLLIFCYGSELLNPFKLLASDEELVGMDAGGVACRAGARREREARGEAVRIWRRGAESVRFGGIWSEEGGARDDLRLRLG